MAIKIDNDGQNIFPTVDFLDAQPDGSGIGLIFGTKIEGQSARVLVRITRAQWTALRTVADGI